MQLVRSLVFVTSLAAVALSARPAGAVCVGGQPDGLVAPTEDCDDNNGTAGDGCSPTCTIEGEFTCGRAINYETLDIVDFPGSTAAWTLTPDDLSGLQTVNTARPTFAIFGQDAQRGTYQVRMQVATAADDDFIGLSFGFQDGDQTNPNANYLVMDWKQFLQSGVGPGLRLAHVRGIPAAVDHIGHGIPQRTCTNPTTSCVTQLANARTRGTAPWADNATYDAFVTYRADRLEIRINDTLEFALSPSDFPGQFPGNVFPPGQIGFYLLSQEQVRYTNLVPFGPSPCNVTSLSPATTSVAVGTPSVTVPVAPLLVDANDELAPASVAVTSITGGGTATVSATGAITFVPQNPAVAGTYVLAVYACDDATPVPDCDTTTVTINYVPDSDGDGVIDTVDLDDDDDGILDTMEGAVDTDGDGTPDRLDLDSDGDGISDVVEGSSGCPDTAPRNGRCDGPDANNDGVVDTATMPAADTDGDGAPDFRDLDTDNDGIPDRAEGPNSLTQPPADTDGDGIADFRDLDTDNDGLVDTIEGGSGCADANQNAVCDGPDMDGDGIADSIDDSPTFGDSMPTVPTNTDGQGPPDYRDLDSDNDGQPDTTESGCVDTTPANDRCDGPDTDADGVVDAEDGFVGHGVSRDLDNDGVNDADDLDDDNDGIPDAAEGNGAVDTDGDGVPDTRDLDSDNDGYPDVAEAGHGGADANFDGILDCVAVGANGLCDALETAPDSGTAIAAPVDTDGDGTADFRDLDSDGDLISDRAENGTACTDTPVNGRCDGADGDRDGVVDSADPTMGFGVGGNGYGEAPDTDGDGVPDFRDLDTDNDGIPDALEGGGALTAEAPDTDGDGAPDFRDLDTDNDGRFDTIEGGSGCTDRDGNAVCDGPDDDGDGIVDSIDDTAGFGDMPGTEPPNTDGADEPDYRDPDSNNDGSPDAVDSGCTDAAPMDGRCDGPDTDGDGVVDAEDGFDGFGVLSDADGDGVSDALDLDDDNDGIPDATEGDGAVDTDGDGTPDSFDLDSDNDGYPDVAEAGHAGADENRDGRVDCLAVGTNGLCDALETAADSGMASTAPIDTDDDTVADFRDLDSDDDGLGDRQENGTDCADTPANGVCDDADSWIGYGTAPDTDGDGTPDYRDRDSDGDGLDDVDEGGNGDGDADGDGKLDGGDADGDGIVDSIDSEPGMFGGIGGTPPDTDGDGTFDYRDLDSDNDGINDGIGVQGGGCSTSGNGGSFGVLAVALAMLLARRRRAAVLVAAAATAPAVAHAQAVSSTYNAERFQLTGHRDGILGVEWAGAEGHLTLDAGLWLGYANDPVNLYQQSSGDRVGSLVANRVGGDLVGAIRLWSRLELGLGAPLIVSQSDDLGSIMPVGGESLSGFGLGDLRLMPKVVLVRPTKGVAIAVMATIGLPTSTSDDYGGDDGVTVSPTLAVSAGRAVGARASLNVGYRMRPEARSLDLVVDDEIFGALGVGYRFTNSLELDASFDVATARDDMFGSFNRNAAEVRAGVGFDVVSQVRLFAAGGIGVAEGFGTPDWRVLAGVRVGTKDEPPARRVAVTPTPITPEPVVDLDPDRDGLLGEADACPNEPEDFDDFEDTGCPDPDNDGDTVLDAADQCRDVFGVVVMQGCPDPDRDGDTVVDRIDNCPDEPGLVDRQGCKQEQLVKIVDGKLEILDIVYFALNKAKIQKRSFKVLTAVADVLKAHPEITKIRIEGHTDSQGNDAYNKKLSQSRAEAVMKFLVKTGVAADRLEALGFGEEQPKATNDTKDGRAINRRVEFVITGGAGVKVDATGPDAETREQ